MRDVVVRARNIELGVGALTRFARHHERENAREVGLVGDSQQVEHQIRMVDEVVRHTERRVEGDDLLGVLRLGALNESLESRGRYRGSRQCERDPSPPPYAEGRAPLRSLSPGCCGLPRCAADARPACSTARISARTRRADSSTHGIRLRFRRPRNAVHVGVAVARHAAADVAAEASSVATSIDGSCVSWPMFLAMTWSMLMPTRMSSASVCLATAPLNQPAELTA